MWHRYRWCWNRSDSRLRKTAHLRRWMARALAAAYLKYASLDPPPSALHLDRFERPGSRWISGQAAERACGMIEEIANYLGASKWLVRTVLGAGLFLGTFLVSLGAVTLVLVKLPADHFASGGAAPQASWHPVLRWAGKIGKNAAGLLLILLGLLLSVPGVPGQGLLTILIGLMLLDFPGKLRLERKMLANRRILRGINALRHRFGKSPLVIRRVRVRPETPDGECSRGGT